MADYGLKADGTPATKAERDSWNALKKSSGKSAARLASDIRRAQFSGGSSGGSHVSGGSSGGGHVGSNYKGKEADEIYTAPDHPEGWGLLDPIEKLDPKEFTVTGPDGVAYRYNPNEESGIKTQLQEWADAGFIPREVQESDTVAFHMDKLLDSNGAYIQQARLQGKQFANSRGMLNSSMAAGAAQKEATKAALPIAQQDAATYFSQGINNQNLANQFQLARQNAGMSGLIEMDRLKQTLDAQFEMWNGETDKFNADMDLKVEMYNSATEKEMAMTHQAQVLARQEMLADFWKQSDFLEANIGLAIEGLKVNVQTTAMNNETSRSISAATIAANAASQYRDQAFQIATNPAYSPQQQIAGVDMLSGLYGNSGSSINNWANM